MLKIDAAAAESLPEPSANPGALEVDPDDLVAEHHGETAARLGQDLGERLSCSRPAAREVRPGADRPPAG